MIPLSVMKRKKEKTPYLKAIKLVRHYDDIMMMVKVYLHAI